MSETKFTAGPWQVDAEYPDDVRDVTGVNLVAQAYTVPVHRGGGHVRRANAALIAAAPDLYKDLQEAVTEMEACAKDAAGTPSSAEFAEKAKRWSLALAKARGESV